MRIYLLLALFVLSITGCKECDEKPTTKNIDYKNTQNWFKLGNATSFDVDVFYLYPTCWEPTPKDGMFCEIDNASMHSKVPNVYSLQAGLFEGFTNMYAPWYRQADAAKILKIESFEERESVFGDIPYTDAINAFEYYLNNYNNGKPFILAGHSQGAAVMKVILEKYMKEHPKVLERMVAAYVLGYAFEIEYFNENKHLHFAKGETDTGVVITWNSERLEDGQFGKVNSVCTPGALSLNPISWKHDYTKIEANDPRNMGSSKLNGAKYSTQVVFDPIRGYEVLIVGIKDSSLDYKFLGDLSLHTSDFTLFYDNIKENAQKRIAAFKK